MTTAFAATFVDVTNVGQNLAIGRYTLQLADSASAGGATWSFSTYFSTVYAISAKLGVSGTAVLQGMAKYGIHGTADTTLGGIATSSTIKFVSYIDTGTTAALFSENTSTDLSSITAAPIMVWGKAV
jgi:hypothetical protein